MLRIVWILIMLATLSGCATVAPPAPAVPTASWAQRQVALQHIQRWQVRGKIAVQTTNDSGSATVDWIETPAAYQVSLLGPLGSGGMALTGRPGSVVLKTNDGKQYTAASAEQLLAEHWGFQVPVSYIKYWIRGLPVPGLNAVTHFDAVGRLSSVQQQGWQVQFLSYTQALGTELPSRITILSPDLKVKLVIYEWR